MKPTLLTLLAVIHAGPNHAIAAPGSGPFILLTTLAVALGLAKQAAEMKDVLNAAGRSVWPLLRFVRKN